MSSPWIVPFLQLAPQAALHARLAAASSRVIGSGRYVGGIECQTFEARVAEFLGVPNVVGCSSGSDALVVALLAFGVGVGDEVVTSPFSFFATVESVLRVGARPVFADLESDRLSLDPGAVSDVITPVTKAILAPHIGGDPGAIAELQRIAGEANLLLIEDAAQAFGSRVHGKAAGSFGDAGCFSFQATKPLGAIGDAGAIVTSDSARAEVCRRLTVHGASARHEHGRVGGNYRLDALQAALLAEKLEFFTGELCARRDIAAAYTENLRPISGLSLLTSGAGVEANHALYTIRVLERGGRDRLAAFLRERGIESSIYYPRPLHRQAALISAGCGLPEGSLPNAERACGEVLSLPIYAALSTEQIELVISSIREFFDRRA